MRPEECKRNTIAYISAFKFPNGNIGPKFFILLDDIDQEIDKVIVATFTTNLRFQREKFAIYVPKDYFKDYFNRPFPFQDSLLECNTCCEIPAKVIRSGRCKFIGRARDIWMSKVYKALEYATRIEARLIVKLKTRLGLK